MSTFVMKNHKEGEEPIIPPNREDGGTFGYCMYFNENEEIAFADTPEELLNIIIPGYLNTSEEEDRDFLRIRLAQTIAAKIQAEILNETNPEELSEKEWATLTLPKSTSIKETLLWVNETPLVLVDTAYLPYSEHIPPASSAGKGYASPNLWWIRAAEEEDLLVSLHEVGEIRLMKNLLNVMEE